MLVPVATSRLSQQLERSENPGRSVVDFGDEFVAADDPHRGSGESHLVAGVLGEENLVARLDAVGIAFRPR